MHPWFVTYTTGPLDVRKTFEVDADTKADAIVLGDTLAAAWLRLHGLVPGDLRGDPADGSESAAARLSYCQPAPPAWVGIFGRRADDGHHTRVTTAPMVSAILDHHGAVPAPWNATDACAFALGDERAETVYQAVKDRLFAGLQTPEWVVTVGRLRELADEIEQAAREHEKGVRHA